ncbi:MAG: FAD binding domain-containing protein [Vulcanimicrobiaceae bacterium]
MTIHRPRTIDEVLLLLETHRSEAKIVAGSTALTILLRQGLISPEALVSLDRICGLHTIDVKDGVLKLGALVTHRAVERGVLVREHVPVLSHAFGVVANVRVRNVATVGGVLAEADYASDPPAVFVMLDAEIVVRSNACERVIPAGEFVRDFYETALEPNEIITGVRVPLPAPRTRAVYEKFSTRSSEDRPCIGVAALVRFAEDNRTCEDVRVVVGAVASTPQRFRDVEALAMSRELTPALAQEIAEEYADRIDPLDDLRGSSWYRREMIRVWVRRALENAYAAA